MTGPELEALRDARSRYGAALTEPEQTSATMSLIIAVDALLDAEAAVARALLASEDTRQPGEIRKGDRVQYVYPSASTLVGTVVEVDTGPPSLTVRWDDDPTITYSESLDTVRVLPSGDRPDDQETP